MGSDPLPLDAEMASLYPSDEAAKARCAAWVRP